MADHLTEHRIVVLGAGYTGMMAAVRVARRTRRHGGRVTLVNPSSRFNERLRMHQMATAQALPDRQIPDMIRAGKIAFVEGWASAIDTRTKQVIVTTSSDEKRIAYDTLVYAIGSLTDTVAVPGADHHAFTLNDPQAANALARRLATLGAGSRVTICGNGLTGIETAAEVAESHPNLRAVLIGRVPPGAMMGPKARAYLHAVLDRLEIERREGVEITKVLPDAVEIDGGELLASDATIWTTGFSAVPLARNAGLTVDSRGRVVVDESLRSVSHPGVFAIGDAAAIRQPWGAIHGTCQSGIPSAAFAADGISRLLKGKSPQGFRFGYIHQPVSLGRHDAVVQFTKADDTPRRWYLKGKRAARYKELVTRSPPATYRISLRLTVPRAILSARGPRSAHQRPT